MTVTASPLPHIIVATVRCSPSQQKSVNGMENHSPIPAAPLTVTHPFIPSLGRENIPLKTLIIKQKAVFKSPLLRGAGVCDAQAQPPQTQSNYLKSNRHFLAAPSFPKRLIATPQPLPRFSP